MLKYDPADKYFVSNTITIPIIADPFNLTSKIPIYPPFNHSKKISDFIESSSFEETGIQTLVMTEDPLDDKKSFILTISEAVNRLNYRIRQIVQKEKEQFDRELDELDELFDSELDEDL